jgi:hypothetical protein
MKGKDPDGMTAILRARTTGKTMTGRRKEKAPQSLMARACIFCGKNHKDGREHRLSREDIWPIWLAKYIPKELKSYHSASVSINKDGSRETIERKIGGDPRSRKITLVCQKCNNGWMSRLQQTAKDLLLPLITGNAVVMGTQQQNLIAKWCAMSTMTADFINPEKQAISQGDRTSLFMDGTLSTETWRIWIGRYIRGQWPSYFLKTSLPYQGNGIVPSLQPSGKPQQNTQITTLVFGELYVHAFSCPDPSLISEVGITLQGAKKLAQIWPVREQFIAWPIVVMNDLDASKISGAIFQRLSGISVLWDGSRPGQSLGG